MTKQEFIKRVNVEVSDNEFSVINEFYMSCECDKDEFCAMWVKMNKARVQNAKVERMLKAKDDSYRKALYKFYGKTLEKDMWTPICYVKMSAYEVQALSYAGIKVENECGSGLKNLMNIRHEIRQYLGI